MEGLSRWLAHKYPPTEQRGLREQVEAFHSRQQQFVSLIRQTAEDLGKLYGLKHDQMALRNLKRKRLAELQADYAVLRAQWGGFTGYDQWFEAGPNNAQLATVTLYNRHLPFFQSLLHDSHGDLQEFYKEVKKISRMSKQCREAFLLGE
jgi:predicted aminopeptidase